MSPHPDAEADSTKAGRHFDFYRDVLGGLLDDGEITRDDTVLVICGGPNDKEVMEDLGFTSVTFCNVDDRMEEVERFFSPFAWKYEHAETLSFAPGSFDLVLVHSGLHHLYRPLVGVTEMYRVARKGVIGFEPNNSWVTRLGVRLGFGQRYETAAVYDNGMTHGGVDNTEIPNHVFRFDAGLLQQTIRSYDPTAEIRMRFWYRMRVPARLFMLRNKAYGWAVRIFGLALTAVGRLPLCANNIAFYIQKPNPETDLHPWLQLKNGKPVVSEDYLRSEYDRNSPAPS